MMTEWSDEIFEALAARSQGLYKNKHLLPVAAWIAGCKLDTISAPDVVRGLDGRREGDPAKQNSSPDKSHAVTVERRA